MVGLHDKRPSVQVHVELLDSPNQGKAFSFNSAITDLSGNKFPAGVCYRVKRALVALHEHGAEAGLRGVSAEHKCLSEVRESKYRRARDAPFELLEGFFLSGTPLDDVIFPFFGECG